MIYYNNLKTINYKMFNNINKNMNHVLRLAVSMLGNIKNIKQLII